MRCRADADIRLAWWGVDVVSGRRGRFRRGLSVLLAIAVGGVGGGSWVSATSARAVASSGVTVTDYAVPGTDPWGTAFDTLGRVWVALPGCDASPSCPSGTPPGSLGLFDPATSSWTTVVSLPAGYGQPLFVAVDALGKVWFTMPVTNTIGAYDPLTATVTQWAVPTVAAGPWDLVIDTVGKIWFTEHYVNKIGSFDPVRHAFREVATPAKNSNPYGITVDAKNNVWFTENTDAVAAIAEYTTSGVLNEFKIRKTSTAGTGLTPHLITVDAQGNVWWSEGWVSSIGVLHLQAARPGTNRGVTEYHYTPSCPSCGSHTSGIRADHQGLIWLDDSLQNTFGSFPVGGTAFTFYNAPSNGGHPHDGLNVDAQNRIWFDEEFANRLAEATQTGSGGSTTSTSTSTSTSSSSSTSSTSTSSSSTSTSASTSTSTSTSTTVPSATVLGTDTFQRPDQALWGTASDGQTWAGDANTQGAFSIVTNSGRVANSAGNTYSAVLGPTAADEEAYMTGSISAFASANFGDVLRWGDDNNWYKAYVDGTSLVIQMKVAGTTTTLASAPFTATAGVSYSIHFRAIGSTLSANVWPASGSEPDTWMLTTSDSTFSSGNAGMRLLPQGGTITITSFRASSL